MNNCMCTQESQIAILYVAGFASSVLFGTCTGPLADLFGRRSDMSHVTPSYLSLHEFLSPNRL